MIGLYSYIKFYTNEECDSMIDYFESQPHLHTHWKENNTNFLNIESNYELPYKKTSHIEQSLNLKLNYVQIVKWPSGSKMNIHKDGDWQTSNHWTSVCYLNDTFEGGRTYIVDNGQNKYVNLGERGSYLCFNSKNIEHGVEIVNGIRYTLTAWYRINV